MKKIVYLFSILVVLISCNKNDQLANSEPVKPINQELITVTLTSIVNGTLSNSSIIEYKDAAGNIISESLNVGTWNKSLTVTKGFNLYLKAKGNINGNIKLKVSAKGNGVSYNNNKNTSSNKDFNFDLEITTIL